MPPPVQVVIAHTPGCGHTAGTRDLVERVAAELAIPVEVTTALVTTPQEAERLRLHGSPTVLVSGRDIDPAMRGRTDHGFT